MPGTRLQALRSWRPWAGTVVALVLSLLSFAWSMHGDRVSSLEHFDTDAALLRERVVRRLAFQEQLLRASAESISQRGAMPSQESWSHYVNSLDLTSFGKAYRGFGVVGWQPDASPAPPAGTRGVPGSAPQPTGTGTVLTVEPLHDHSRGILGRDLYAEPFRRAAMARACDTGAPTLTNPVTLAREDTSVNPTGVLFFTPIYRQGRPLDSVPQRREALLGWVYQAFRTEPLMASVLEPSPKGTGLEAYVGSSLQEEALFCRLAPDGPASAASYITTGAVEVYGQLWVFRVWPGVHTDFLPSKKGRLNLLLFRLHPVWQWSLPFAHSRRPSRRRHVP